MKKFLTSLLLLALTAGFAISQDKAAATESVTASGLTFTFGKPWQKMKPASSMRAGQLKYDNEGDLADVEAVFFHFGPNSGSVDANLQRWKGQFQGEVESKTEEKDHNGTKVTYFTATGTFMDGGFGQAKTAKDDWIMLAAIVPGTDGVVFIKFVGPKAAVEAAKTDFEKLAASPFSKAE
ncbi:MAG: hypothetical protein ACKVJU_01260 [Verrucomicrobiales bacterium]